MNKNNLFIIFIILLLGSILIFISKNSYEKKEIRSFSTLFQTTGQATRTVSTAVGSVMMVDHQDEIEYGKKIRTKYKNQFETKSKEYKYLNRLAKKLSKYSRRGFEYKVFIQKSHIPNAYVLPGGTIVVTTKLIEISEYEDEIFAILSHEAGHCEQSHTLNKIKYMLATKKYIKNSTGVIVDELVNIFLSISYSKTEENDADMFAFESLLNHNYNPYGLSKMFRKLQKFSKRRGNRQFSPLKDYFKTHPDIEIRINKYEEMAKNKSAKLRSKKLIPIVY